MNCNIASDLIPLYAERLCSEETSAELEKHLYECNSCSEKFRNYNAEIPETPPENITPRKVFKKVRLYVVFSAVIIGALLLLSGLFGVYMLYAKNLGYMRADKEFFGYDEESIIRNCDTFLMKIIEDEVLYNSGSAKWTEYFGDMSIEEFNGWRKTMKNISVDYSSLSLREYTAFSDTAGDSHCNFFINGKFGANGKYNYFSADFVRLEAGRYRLTEVNIPRTPDGEGLLPEGYSTTFYAELEASDKAARYLSEYEEYRVSEDIPDVYFTPSAENPADGVYTADDGSFIKVEGNKISVPVKNTKGDIHNIEYEYISLDAEMVYPDGTAEYKHMLNDSALDYKLGMYYPIMSVYYENGALYYSRTGKEYRLSRTGL